MGLFISSWRSENKEKALNTVAKTKSQRKLAQIAKNAPVYEACQAAVESLAVLSLLADVAENAVNIDIRASALYKLINTEGKDYRKRYSDSETRKLVNKLTDQTILIDMIKNSSDYGYYTEMIKRLTDQALIADFINNCEDSLKRFLIVKYSLTDQATLSLLAKSKDEGEDMRFTALAKLTNKALARKIYNDIVDNYPEDKRKRYSEIDFKRMLQNECGEIGHDWDGCTCIHCGETHAKGHDWDGCKCKRCGASGNHDWDGCKCKRCGISGNHDWDGCMCNRCGETRNEEHVWLEVPGSAWSWSSGSGGYDVQCSRCGAYESR